MWSDFETNILPQLRETLPLMLAKMEFHRSFISELEVRFGFTLESLEEFWNLTKSRVLQPSSGH
jgi:hypothetical protein